MNFDVERARRETPGTQNVIHLNNAGASLMPAPVIDAVQAHIKREAEMGGYEAAGLVWDKFEAVYDKLAKLLNCQAHEIGVVENATRAWDMLFYSLSLSAGDRILTSKTEYASNYLAYLQVAKRTGCDVVPVASDDSGAISVEALRATLDDRVKLISLSHIPTNGGLVNPASAVGKIAREAGVPFLLDACQSVGQMPIDVAEIGCDMLTATSRKYLRGPRGVGFLYVRETFLEKLDPPFVDLHAAEWTGTDRFKIRDDARRFETWECNWAGKIGLGEAIDYAQGWGLPEIQERLQKLATHLRSRLNDISGVKIRDLGHALCGIVSFTVDWMDHTELQQVLRAKHANIGVSPENFTLLDMQARGLKDVARASVHYYNTENELEEFCALIEGLRG